MASRGRRGLASRYVPCVRAWEPEMAGQRQSGWGVAGSGRLSGAMTTGKQEKTRVPDRWTHYLPLGRRIPGTRFIAFKVPLKKSFEWRLAPNERFSPLDLVNQIREQKEELGLIIDLTYTTRYYEPEELPDTLQYCKILTVGHEVPDHDTVFKFKSAVKKFLMENSHNDKLIGVHCTHGLNRTGYLVCRYLIDVEGMDPTMAIQLFNRHRGHSIERKNYIEDLKREPRRKNQRMPVSGCSWIQGHFGPTANPGFEAVEYRSQNFQQFPRHFSSRTEGGGHKQRRKVYHTGNPNLITCYDKGQSVYNPHYASTTNVIQQRPDHRISPNRGLFYSPYQPQSQEYEGPYFQMQNRHYPLQGRYKIDRRSHPY